MANPVERSMGYLPRTSTLGVNPRGDASPPSGSRKKLFNCSAIDQDFGIKLLIRESIQLATSFLALGLSLIHLANFSALLS